MNGNFSPSRPFQVVVSDTTLIYCKGVRYDWTYYIDVFNNEIISSDIQTFKHGNGIVNHINACKQFLEEKEKEDIKTLRLSSIQIKVLYTPQKPSTSFLSIIP